MIAITGYEPVTRTWGSGYEPITAGGCRCPNCGYIHGGNETTVLQYPVRTAWGRRDYVQEFKAAVRKSQEYHAAIAEARRKSVQPLPEPPAPRLRLAARDPLREHRQRCVMRRPRLSLLDMARAVVSRRTR